MVTNLPRVVPSELHTYALGDVLRAGVPLQRTYGTSAPGAVGVTAKLVGCIGRSGSTHLVERLTVEKGDPETPIPEQ